MRCRHLGRRPSHWRCCHFRKVEFRQQPRHLTPRIATCHEIPAATRHSSAERFCALKWWLLRFLALAVQLLWGRTATLPQARLPETLFRCLQQTVAKFPANRSELLNRSQLAPLQRLFCTLCSGQDLTPPAPCPPTELFQHTLAPGISRLPPDYSL